ncbi:MAG: Gfo/Idh/MocA family oxidoreductase [Clostridiales bacterium]|nr:Gfo/Idh/MocA family oxidoreductase [Clostridiales bacterium]
MKFGILGAGHIAKKMATTLMQMKKYDIECAAVGARDINRAKEFAKKYEIGKAYGSYEELVSDPDIDVIYVATPHSHHYEHAKLCLEFGKHVLCEKSFTVNADQAKKLIQLAESKELLLAEAIWTRYLPMRKVLDDLLKEQVIGKITTLTANLGYCMDQVPRLQDPELAGGALLDVGVYTLNFAAMVFGYDIKEIQSTCVKTATGVDQQNSITITYQNGAMAMLHSTMSANTDRRGMLYGDKGAIEVVNINNCEEIIITLNDGTRRVIKRPEQITGFEYQVLSVAHAIAEDKTECPEMPHADIIAIMEQMDSLRKEWGIHYGTIEEA